MCLTCRRGARCCCTDGPAVVFRRAMRARDMRWSASYFYCRRFAPRWRWMALGARARSRRRVRSCAAVARRALPVARRLGAGDLLVRCARRDAAAEARRTRGATDESNGSPMARDARTGRYADSARRISRRRRRRVCGRSSNAIGRTSARRMTERIARGNRCARRARFRSAARRTAARRGAATRVRRSADAMAGAGRSLASHDDRAGVAGLLRGSGCRRDVVADGRLRSCAEATAAARRFSCRCALRESTNCEPSTTPSWSARAPVAALLRRCWRRRVSTCC